MVSSPSILWIVRAADLDGVSLRLSHICRPRSGRHQFESSGAVAELVVMGHAGLETKVGRPLGDARRRTRFFLDPLPSYAKTRRQAPEQLHPVLPRSMPSRSRTC